MDPFQFIKMSNDTAEQKARLLAQEKEKAFDKLLKAAMNQRDMILNSHYPQYLDQEFSDAIKKCNLILSGEPK